MKVINIHRRVLQHPHALVSPLFDTLATKNDVIWPKANWPAMCFKDGLVVNAHGGHGPITYNIEELVPGSYIRFRFSRPHGFDGTHALSIRSISLEETELHHEINMEVKGLALLKWGLGIRWLHDALIEDAFDNVQNQFSDSTHTTPWSAWVKILRWSFGAPIQKRLPRNSNDKPATDLHSIAG